MPARSSRRLRRRVTKSSARRSTMKLAEWLVLVGGVTLILWIQWYFFLAGKESVAARETSGGVQEVHVVVRGGYEPSLVKLKAGRKARLVFDRQEDSGCSEE